MPRPVGNLLGAPRAEADTLLSRAFVETPDFQALTSTRDFNFVVGRRGTGKSALFQMTRAHFSTRRSTIVLSEIPPEHETLELQHILRRCGSYRLMRATARLAWRAQILMEVADRLLRQSQQHLLLAPNFLESYRDQHQALFDIGPRERHVAVLKLHTSALESPEDAPAAIARALGVEQLQREVFATLSSLSSEVFLLYDGLDEGWDTTEVASATLGGLAAAISSFADASPGIHGVLFVRDNMLRALAHFDSDFSRTVEGNTLRLHWDEGSLLHLVANRIRIALKIERTESDLKVWNRFAQRDLAGREGFRRCLELTLYRPRDILVLLNRAHLSAARQGRTHIVYSDITSASSEISNERLADLLKEYDRVLPGLALFIDLFRARVSVSRVGAVLVLIQDGMEKARESVDPRSQDFALLGAANEIFWALFEVGFIGIREPAEDRFVFCHDGLRSLKSEIEPERETLIHPCYWKALSIRTSEGPPELASDVTDDYTVIQRSEVADIRARKIGSTIAELSGIAEGRDGAARFEQWVLRAAQILFQGKLNNLEGKPNPGRVSQRDIVATNVAERGFWRRIREDYDTRQVVFEVKNYAELTQEDFRQVLAYSGGEFGRFTTIVYRSKEEGVTPTVRSWLQEVYHNHRLVVLLVPVVVIQRSLQKLRIARRYDYAEDQLSKRMDTLVRRYLQIEAGRSYRTAK